MKQIQSQDIKNTIEKYSFIITSDESKALITSLALSFICFLVLKFVIIKYIKNRVNLSSGFSKAFNKTNFLEYFTYIFPLLIINIGISGLPFYDSISKIIYVCLSILIILVFTSSTKIIEIWYKSLEISKKYPINSYTQLSRLIIILMGVIIVISILLGKSPVFLLSAAAGFGTLLLIFFKDTLTSFVTGIQIAVDNLIQEDDWIVVPSLNADGIVVSVKLNFIQVRNWDNTIVNIPTYLLSTGSFSNWRNVFESGARRIMTSIPIDQSTVRELSVDEIRDLRNNKFISKFLDNEIFDNVHKGGIVNLTLFRKFIYSYLLSNENLNKDFTCLVRLMDSTQYGIPIQIYCYSSVTRWIDYENLKSEIIEKIIYASKIFKLEVFQVTLPIKL